MRVQSISIVINASDEIGKWVYGNDVKSIKGGLMRFKSTRDEWCEVKTSFCEIPCI